MYFKFVDIDLNSYVIESTWNIVLLLHSATDSSLQHRFLLSRVLALNICSIFLPQKSKKKKKSNNTNIIPTCLFLCWYATGTVQVWKREILLVAFPSYSLLTKLGSAILTYFGTALNCCKFCVYAFGLFSYFRLASIACALPSTYMNSQYKHVNNILFFFHFFLLFSKQ